MVVAFGLTAPSYASTDPTSAEGDSRSVPEAPFEDGEAYMGWSEGVSEELAPQPQMRALNMVPTAVPIPPGVAGIDVSSWQTDVDWQYQWDQGYRFAYIKATEGAGYKNPLFTEQYNGAYNQGMIRGSYHFARPDLNSGTEEARYFVANGGNWSADGKTLPGVLDIEYAPRGDKCYDLGPSELVDWIDDFLTTYKSLAGREAMVYTNYHWWNDCTDNSARFSKTNSLWIARYSEIMGPLPGEWQHQTIWQFSDKPIDQSSFNGTPAQLARFAEKPGVYNPSKATHVPDVTRIAGEHRYETAATLSRETFEVSNTVFIASGGDFADALAVGVAAAVTESPLLFSGEGISRATKEELERLAPEKIVVAGGKAAVSNKIVKQLQQYAPVERWSGKNRYETAGAIARNTYTEPTGVAYIASGAGFPDALAGGPAAAFNGAPLLLTSPDHLPSATVNTLRELGVERIIVLGGKSAVSNAVVKQLEGIAPTSRIAGTNRYETAAKVTEHAFPRGAANTVVASGEDFPDALSGGSTAGFLQGPVLLAQKGRLTSVTASTLEQQTPDQILVVGGKSVISNSVVRDIREIWD